MKNQNAQAPTAPNVHHGTYTIQHATRGHFTLKLYTVTTGSPDFVGKRIIALLVGPDNTSNYRGVAFWNDEERFASCWRRFQGTRHVHLDGKHWQPDGLSSTQNKLCIWADLVNRGAEGYWGQEGYTLLLEGRCSVCNRKLTTPESIELGIGPKCRGDR